MCVSEGRWSGDWWMIGVMVLGVDEMSRCVIDEGVRMMV